MLKTVTGTLLLVLAAFMLLGFALSENDDTAATIFALLVAVVTPAGAGIALIRSARRAESARRVDRAPGPRPITRVQLPETEILALAGRREGRITDVEASAQLGIPIEEVREHLDSLVRKEVAEIEVTDSGLFVYSFPGFLSAQEKDDAKGLLES